MSAAPYQGMAEDIATAGRMLAAIRDDLERRVLPNGDDRGLMIAAHAALAEAIAATRAAYKAARLVTDAA